LKFIEHNQPAEFIEVYKMHKARNMNLNLTSHIDDIGKTFLHLAVEHQANKIISFLMFECKIDPNLLTHNT